MKTLLRILLPLVFVLVVITSYATDKDYDTLMLKARRFADWKEWRSAAAMYQLAAQQQPTSPHAYAPAMIIYGMLGDTDEVSDLLTTALKAGIPPDSLFNAARSASIEISHLNLYEQFLLTARRCAPYLTRAINDRLLDYYTFRNDGPKMTEYAELMLPSDSIDNKQIPYLTRLALGYIDMGRTQEAMYYFQQILKNDPDNLNALLYLGNYYAQTGEMQQALPYLLRARTIRPSLYLNSIIPDSIHSLRVSDNH